jgi:putative acetyltransferase
MLVRAEMPHDVAAITTLLKEAFADHPYSHQTEHILVEELRKSDALSVSLVAEEAGQVAGHIAFSAVKIGGEDLHWCGMGPLSVRRTWQRQGIGKALVAAGLEAIRAQGAAGCVLVGDPAYYGRFGFHRMATLTLADVPAEYFLALAFGDTLPHGQVTFHPAFAACAG